ncbi:hypothetical protein BZA70DRAFT_273724 [Myxozyma melibiosi]|uniref:Uncharacterized protein n=1 Tax=Myxozyma melibiosi TaxID=54550 RepID=A0ABR1FF19_9ASCO
MQVSNHSNATLFPPAGPSPARPVPYFGVDPRDPQPPRPRAVPATGQDRCITALFESAISRDKAKASYSVSRKRKYESDDEEEDQLCVLQQDECLQADTSLCNSDDSAYISPPDLTFDDDDDNDNDDNGPESDLENEMCKRFRCIRLQYWPFRADEDEYGYTHDDRLLLHSPESPLDSNDGRSLGGDFEPRAMHLPPLDWTPEMLLARYPPVSSPVSSSSSPGQGRVNLATSLEHFTPIATPRMPFAEREF